MVSFGLRAWVGFIFVFDLRFVRWLFDSSSLRCAVVFFDPCDEQGIEETERLLRRKLELRAGRDESLPAFLP